MKITLEPAFILHTKSYRETSLLVDFFTLNQGRVSVIAKSARGPRSRFRNCLVPFSPLIISAQGRSDLLQLTLAEPSGAAYFLQGLNLFSGLYLNELLLRLLQRSDAVPKLFHYYHEAIKKLSDQKLTLSKILRQFEKQLLNELGYGLHLSEDIFGQKIIPDHFYLYKVGSGLVPYLDNDKAKSAFVGGELLAIDENNFSSNEILKTARRLMRLVLTDLLGDYQLKSRELF